MAGLVNPLDKIRNMWHNEETQEKRGNMITTEAMKKKRRNVHYVNNRDFLNALIQYRDQVRRCQEEGLPKPVLPNYIGECFIKIANHLSFKPNFVNYSYKDDMISDGIENCIQCVLNFDPEKSQNPFAYFTQIITYAFIRRINKEKRQMEIKEKIIEKTGFDQVFFDDGEGSDNYSDYNTIKDGIQTKTRY